MQFAASEELDVLRQKNRLMQATVAPEGLTFDTSLHAEEMMPDNHVHCFRDFEDWLTKKTDFSEPTPENFEILDGLALSRPEEAVNSYNTIKAKWYEQCLQESPPAPNPANTHPGSTDSSLDIFNLMDQSYTIMDAKLHATRQEATEDADAMRKTVLA